jgi:hypothetical protein
MPSLSSGLLKRVIGRPLIAPIKLKSFIFLQLVYYASFLC